LAVKQVTDFRWRPKFHLGQGVTAATLLLFCEIILMNSPRYIVFDDDAQARGLDCTPDQFADALRPPLAAIGVRVMRKQGTGSTSPSARFQGRGLSRSQYNAKLNMATHIVEGIMKGLAENQGCG
jgi:hypothetical protein